MIIDKLSISGNVPPRNLEEALNRWQAVYDQVSTSNPKNFLLENDSVFISRQESTSPVLVIK